MLHAVLFVFLLLVWYDVLLHMHGMFLIVWIRCLCIWLMLLLCLVACAFLCVSFRSYARCYSFLLHVLSYVLYMFICLFCSCPHLFAVHFSCYSTASFHTCCFVCRALALLPLLFRFRASFFYDAIRCMFLFLFMYVLLCFVYRFHCFLLAVLVLFVFVCLCLLLLLLAHV